MGERLVHVEIGGQILCSDRLTLLNCDWRSEEVMYDKITCPACLKAAAHRFDDEEEPRHG